MITFILSKVFPPKLGKIEGVETVLRLQALKSGTLKAYRAEDPQETGIGRVYEWPEGRHRKPKRLR